MQGDQSLGQRSRQLQGKQRLLLLPLPLFLSQDPMRPPPPLLPLLLLLWVPLLLTEALSRQAVLQAARRRAPAHNAGMVIERAGVRGHCMVCERAEASRKAFRPRASSGKRQAQGQECIGS